MDYFWWAVVCFATFLIGLTKSGFGAGVGLMIIPMTAIAMSHHPQRGTEAALGLLLPLLTLGDLIAVYQYRKLFSLNIVKHLLPGTLIGVVLGGAILWWFHTQAGIVGALIRIEIGIESIALVGLHWWRQYKGVQEHLMREPWRSHLTGAFAGTSSTLAHAAGPIAAMYLLPLRLDRQLFVGTCAIYFFILNTIKIPAYIASNMFEKAELSFTLKFLPLVILGAVVGFAVNKKLSDKYFSRIIYTVTFALGWYILFDGIRQLISIHSAGGTA
jgi:uncharacterized membrane protein YfcA